MSENGNPAGTPEEEVKRVRKAAALAFHEYRKALMPVAGSTEYCIERSRQLFSDLEELAGSLPDAEARRLREVMGKPRDQIGPLLEQSHQRLLFLLASMEQLVQAVQFEDPATWGESVDE